jgi:hypothetical protein
VVKQYQKQLEEMEAKVSTEMEKRLQQKGVELEKQQKKWFSKVTGGKKVKEIEKQLADLEAERAKMQEQAKDLSPSTALYIPFDACCTYVSTSHIRSASSASGVYLRVWGLDPRHGSGAPVRDVRLFFRPVRPPKRPLVAQPGRRVELGRHISRSSSSRARNRCARFASARIMELLVSLSPLQIRYVP